MRQRTRLSAVCSALLVCSLPAIAQRGLWKAAGKTAQSITGDIAFLNERMTINFFTFPIAEIRQLQPDEILAAFNSAVDQTGTGHLYRVSISGDKRFLHKNTLCGSEETQWMATYVSGKDLDIVFFSGATPPAFTSEALNNSPNLCGTYSYVR